MRKIFYILAPIAMVFASCDALLQSAANEPAQSQSYYAEDNRYDNNSDQLFYDELSPYGNWIDYPDYGYVWSPNVSSDFRPYATNGYWVYTDYGWTWASDYHWGWAAFHYGRWFYDDYYGWLWMPGHQWAPAWVVWGNYNDYYCWAPLAPYVDVASNDRWMPAANSWNMIRGRYITRNRIDSYIETGNYRIVNRITIIDDYQNNSYRRGRYNRGPRVNDIESITGQRIDRVKIVSNNNARPNSQVLTNNQFPVYRPATPSYPNNNKVAPRRYEPFRHRGEVDNIHQNQSVTNGGNNNQHPNNPSQNQWNGGQRSTTPPQNQPNGVPPNTNQNQGQHPNNPTNNQWNDGHRSATPPQNQPNGVPPNTNQNQGQHPNNPSQNQWNGGQRSATPPQNQPNGVPPNTNQNQGQHPNNPSQNQWNDGHRSATPPQNQPNGVPPNTNQNQGQQQNNPANNQQPNNRGNRILIDLNKPQNQQPNNKPKVDTAKKARKFIPGLKS